jgi:hypothetical protein
MNKWDKNASFFEKNKKRLYKWEIKWYNRSREESDLWRGHGKNGKLYEAYLSDQSRCGKTGCD